MLLSFADRLKLFRKAAVGLFSDTSSQQAYGMLAGIFPGAVGQPPKRGTRELLNAYNEMPWLRAVVNKVSRSVASVPWKLYVVRRGGKAVKVSKMQQADYVLRQKFLAGYHKQGELTEIEEHPLLDLLNRPNPFLTGLITRQLTQIHLDLVGEAFWLKERNGAGKPSAVWPLPPDWVISTPTPVHRFFRVSFRGWQGEIPDTEILWLADPDPSNPYGRGSGMARALGDELETDEYAAKHTKSWFYNRARPDVIISADGLKKEETDRLEQDWLAKNQGFWRVYKPYFLNRKIDIQTLSQTFENMQLVDLRKHERDTIIQVFGVPPEILGIIENSNRATIEASDYLFSRWVVQPRLEFLRSVLQERLVPEYDDRLILDYESPVAEDKEYNLKVAQAAPWTLTADEWRELQGRKPLPDEQGKIHMVPFNLLPARDLAAGGNPQPAQPASNPASAGKEDVTQGEGAQARIQTKAVKAIDSDDSEAIKQILAALGVDYLIKHMKPVYEETAATFGQEILDVLGVGISFDLGNPRVVDFLKTEATKYIKGVNETTRAALQATLVEGVEAGESIPKLADRISAVFTQAKGYRSEMIARTEVVRASNFGSMEGMVQGGAERKEWLATRDDRTRESHMETDGQIQPVNEPFELGSGVKTMYPGASGWPEEDINCFPGDVLVDSPAQIEAATKRWYEGELVEIVTAGGDKLSGTPNHLILTDRGWIALGELEEGCRVVSRFRRKEMSLSHPDVNHMPTPISQIFDLLLVSGAAERRCGVNEQFHGDGRTGYVDIIRSHGALQFGGQPSFGQPSGEQSFALADLAKGSLFSDGLPMDSGFRFMTPPQNGMRGVGKVQTFFGAESGHADDIGFTPITRVDPSFDQVAADAIPRNPIMFGEGEFAFPSQIAPTNFSDGQFMLDARLDAEALEMAEQCVFSDAQINSDASNGQSLPVQFDRVVEKRRLKWSGHVYNLQTQVRWYIANNIIAHNCRCAIAPIVGERSLYDTEEKRFAAWKKYDADLKPWERRMSAAAKKAFQAQQDAVMAELKRLGRESD